MKLFRLFRNLNIALSEDQQYLNIDYRPSSSKPLYDICDENGKIIKTGKITRESMKVAVNDLLSSAYIFLILDGDQIKKQRFEINR